MKGTWIKAGGRLRLRSLSDAIKPDFGHSSRYSSQEYVTALERSKPWLSV